MLLPRILRSTAFLLGALLVAAAAFAQTSEPARRGFLYEVRKGNQVALLMGTTPWRMAAMRRLANSRCLSVGLG